MFNRFYIYTFGLINEFEMTYRIFFLKRLRWNFIVLGLIACYFLFGFLNFLLNLNLFFFHFKLFKRIYVFKFFFFKRKFKNLSFFRKLFLFLFFLINFFFLGGLIKYILLISFFFFKKSLINILMISTLRQERLFFLYSRYIKKKNEF